MSTLDKILTSDQDGKRLWLINGSNPSLVEQSYQVALNTIITDENYRHEVLFGDQTTEADIWDKLVSYYSEGQYLLVVHDFDKLVLSDRLIGVLHKLPKTHAFIAISNLATLEVPTNFSKLFTSAKGRQVSCSSLGLQGQLTCLEELANLDSEAALFIAQKANGDMEWLFNTIKKLNTLGIKANVELCRKIILDSGVPDFSRALISGQKRTALISLSKGSNAGSIKFLVTTMKRACLLHEVLRSVGRYNKRSVLEQTGFTNKQYELYLKFAKQYGPNNLFKYLVTLSRLYEKLITGEKAYWQCLVAKW